MVGTDALKKTKKDDEKSKKSKEEVKCEETGEQVFPVLCFARVKRGIDRFYHLGMVDLKNW